MRKRAFAPMSGLGAALLSLVALGPMAFGQDAQPPAQGAWIGVVTRALTDSWRESKGYTASGVMVIEVAPGSPADQLGVSPGDVLVTVDSRTLRQPSDLDAAEAAMTPGRPVEVILARDGGHSIKIFTLEPAKPRAQSTSTTAAAGSEAPASPSTTSAPAGPSVTDAGAAGAGAVIGAGAATGTGAASGTNTPTGTSVAPGANAPGVSGSEATPIPPPPGQVSTPADPEPTSAATPATPDPVAATTTTDGPRDAENGLGVRCENLTLDLATAMKAPAGQGVLVLTVTTGGPADKAGIRPGDVISRAGGQPVPDVDRLNEILAAASTPLSVVTTRSGSTRVVAADLTLPVAPPKPAEPVVEPLPAVEMTQEQLIASLRDEVRSLRDEVRKLREEMANWARATRPQP